MIKYLFQLVHHFFGIIKKVLIVIVVFAFIITIFSISFSKNRPQYDSERITKLSRKLIYQTLQDPKLNSDTTGKLALYLYRTQVCMFSGEACTDNPEDGDKNAPKSLIGLSSNLLSIPFTNPPASGIYWAFTGLENAGFIPKTYAAEGIGFGSLKPLMNIWKIFRDIAYMLLVLVLVSIGFMIMFRMKINPQTVISVENALPKIVTTLILITFSFAIAGFLVDMMYVFIVVIISILSNNNTYYDTGVIQNLYLNAGPTEIYQSLFPVKENIGGLAGMFGLGTIVYVGTAVQSFLPIQIRQMSQILGGILGTWYALKGIGGIVNNYKTPEMWDNIELATFSLGKIPSGAIGSIIFTLVVVFVGSFTVLYGLGFFLGLLIYFTVIFLVFRIFALLFKAYMTILFSVMFAPIILIIEAIPGKSSFSMWFKNLFAELLTFPIVITVFLIGNIMLNSLAYPGDFWVPPFMTNIDPLGFSILVGMGLMFLIPDLVKLTKDALGVKGLPINVGLGTLFGGASAGTGALMGSLQQLSTLNLGIGALTGGKTLKTFVGDLTSKKAPTLKNKGTKAATGDED